MIKNISYIKGVGKFKDCKAGGITFLDKVLIFGRNTYGKSTLTSIFSSLKNLDSDLIVGRKTFGETAKQEIYIKIDDNNFIFKNGSWNSSYGNMEIFDTKYITDNICNAENISYDQQKNLNQVVLGSKGQKLVNEIKKLTENITELSNKKREMTNNFFNPILQSKSSTEEFIKLEPIGNIDKEIETQRKIINQFKNKIKINKNIKDSFFNLDFEKFEITFKKKISFDSKIIESHLNENFDDSILGKRFLQEGISMLKKDKCLFCGQDFNALAKKLIDSYREVFSVEFESIKNEVDQKLEEFSRLNFKDKINMEILEFKELGLDLPIYPLEKETLQKLKTTIETLFKNKKNNLSQEIDLTKNPDWLEIKKIFNKVTSFLNAKEKEFSVVIGSSDKEEYFEKLLLIKKRFEKETIENISIYNKYNEQITNLQKERDGKQKELEKYAGNIFEKCGGKINKFLKEMNSNFELDNFSHLKKLRGRDESLFCINFDCGNRVDIYECDNCKPNFKNTLSESDKRTLAFAFFLAKLSEDENLDKKIIIFDDPISSFDRERKRKTCHLLLDLNCNNKKPKQTIILTHQEDFLKDLARDLTRSSLNYLPLKIKDGNLEIIKDINKEFPDDRILDSLDNLREILDTENFEKNFFVESRIILENIIKRKYHTRLKNLLASNPRAGIRTFVDEIYDNTTQQHKDLIRLCDDLQVPLHDNSFPTPSTGDKKSILKDFFTQLEKL